MPVATTIVDDLSNHTASPSVAALLVTIWELGEAAGPLLIAPLSEVYGRYPVMNVCNILFISASLLAAVSNSTALFIGARALTGAAVASNVINPAIIGDLFVSEQRGSALSLVMLAPLIGGAIGPAIGGAIAQTLGWRFVLFIATALALTCEIVFVTCFRETYKMVILKRKVARMQKDAGRGVSEDIEDEPSDKLWYAITRPFTVLFGSSVLLAMSLFGSVMFSYFYVLSTTLPGILQDRYGFTPAQTGTSFLCFSKLHHPGKEVELTLQASVLSSVSSLAILAWIASTFVFETQIQPRKATQSIVSHYRSSVVCSYRFLC